MRLDVLGLARALGAVAPAAAAPAGSIDDDAEKSKPSKNMAAVISPFFIAIKPSVKNKRLIINSYIA